MSTTIWLMITAQQAKYLMLLAKMCQSRWDARFNGTGSLHEASPWGCMHACLLQAVWFHHCTVSTWINNAFKDAYTHKATHASTYGPADAKQVSPHIQKHQHRSADRSMCTRVRTESQCQFPCVKKARDDPIGLCQQKQVLSSWLGCARRNRSGSIGTFVWELFNLFQTLLFCEILRLGNYLTFSKPYSFVEFFVREIIQPSLNLSLPWKSSSGKI